MAELRNNVNKGSIPFRDKVLDQEGFISSAWAELFRYIKNVVDPLGIEKSFSIVTTASPLNVEGLLFSSSNTSAVQVEWLAQRTNDDVIIDPVELVEAGRFWLVYKPKSAEWVITGSSSFGPHDSGVDFTVTTSGQVRYTASAISGTVDISKLTFRARTFSAKNYRYSSVGPGPIL